VARAHEKLYGRNTRALQNNRGEDKKDDVRWKRWEEEGKGGGGQ
jgi:hypothetical protein